MYLTDVTTVTTYCRAVRKSLNILPNTSCPYNGTLSMGSYSVVVYVIESDGSVSPVLAISGEILNIPKPSSTSPGIHCMGI